MTELDPASYKAAAAALEDSLRAAYPDYRWRVPSAFWPVTSMNNEGFVPFDAALFQVYVYKDGYGARLPVTVGIEQDTDAVRIAGQQAIDTLARYRHNTP